VDLREGDNRAEVANKFCATHWEVIKASEATEAECVALLANYMSSVQNRLDAVLGQDTAAANQDAASSQRPLLSVDITADDRQLKLEYFEGLGRR
jgi:hypothetical protein